MYDFLLNFTKDCEISLSIKVYLDLNDVDLLLL